VRTRERGPPSLKSEFPLPYVTKSNVRVCKIKVMLNEKIRDTVTGGSVLASGAQPPASASPITFDCSLGSIQCGGLCQVVNVVDYVR
jgi:hypothetical protein